MGLTQKLAFFFEAYYVAMFPVKWSLENFKLHSTVGTRSVLRFYSWRTVMKIGCREILSRTSNKC